MIPPRPSARALLASLPKPVPVFALPGDDPSRDDWSTCPHCKFILVACDCDAPHHNLEHRHAA